MKMVNRRVYNPEDDTFTNVSEPLIPSQEEQDLRIRCLQLAVDSVKHGASFGQPVVKVAEAYRLFSLGELPPSDPFAGLSFEQRLEALISEFLNAEIEDARKIKHLMGEVFNRLDNAYPDPRVNEVLEKILEEEPDEEINILPDGSIRIRNPDNIVMQHKDIRS